MFTHHEIARVAIEVLEDAAAQPSWENAGYRWVQIEPARAQRLNKLLRASNVSHGKDARAWNVWAYTEGTLDSDGKLCLSRVRSGLAQFRHWLREHPKKRVLHFDDFPDQEARLEVTEELLDEGYLIIDFDGDVWWKDEAGRMQVQDNTRQGGDPGDWEIVLEERDCWPLTCEAPKKI